MRKHANPESCVCDIALRAMLRKQARRPGVGNDRADHQRWPNAYFANAGLFALHNAWQSAR
jgi:RNA-directed DNA polymerase